MWICYHDQTGKWAVKARTVFVWLEHAISSWIYSLISSVGYVKISQGKRPKDHFSYSKYHKKIKVFSYALANRGPFQYGAHVSNIGQMLNEWRVSGPIFRDIRTSIVCWLVCWSKLNKRTLRKEKRATRQAWTRNPKRPHFQHVSLMGLTEAQYSATLHKSQNRGCPLSHFSNGSLLPSCMGRWGLSLIKEINTYQIPFTPHYVKVDLL